MKAYTRKYNVTTMWEIVPGRLESAMQRAGVNQSQLAAAVGVKQPSIGRLLSGETKTTRALELIASTLGTTPEYLKGEADDPTLSDERAAITIRVPVKNPDLVEISELDVSYGLGAAFIHDAPVKSKLRTFSRSWVRQFTDSPFETLFWATSNGTSMMPAILENDTLLIDTTQNSPRMWDQFWAIDMHGMGMIKSLRPAKEGAMRIISINPDFPEEVAYDGEMNVVGRVVAIVRKV